MGSYPDEFPFGIMEVVELLHLRVRRQQANSVYVDCPFCGDRRGRMNVNFVKNVWRCNHCDEHGGMLALYAKLNHTTTSDAYWEIAEALCDNIQEEHARSGNEAQRQTASAGSPSSGARAAAAGHSSSERKIVPQSDKASPAEIHQTLCHADAPFRGQTATHFAPAIEAWAGQPPHGRPGTGTACPVSAGKAVQ